MADVQQAVLEFDEAVQAPWRSVLRCVGGEEVERFSRPGGSAAARPGAYRDRVGRSRPALAPAERRAPARIGQPSLAAGDPASSDAPVRRSPDRSRAGAVPARRRPVPTAEPPRRPAPARTSAHPAAGAARAASAPVRLTRRARRLSVVLALAGGVALGSWLAPLVNGGDGDLRLAGVSAVVVAPGDTLWSIASGVAGDRDVRDVVQDILELNRLESTVVEPGQVLQLP